MTNTTNRPATETPMPKPIPDDATCTDCGEQPRKRTCDCCGADALITDCGHMPQPRPIAASGTVDLCDECAAASKAPTATRRAIEALTFHVPPACQGQIVEVAYAADGEGGIVRRRTDRSLSIDDSTRVTYQRGEWLDDEAFAPWNGEPADRAWTEIE